MGYEKKTTIPFGAFDSELHYQEINIPDGFEATIKDNKVIFKKKENEDEKKELVEEVYSHLDSIKDTADRMTSGNFMHNKAAIKFSVNTIVKVLEIIWN